MNERGRRMSRSAAPPIGRRNQARVLAGLVAFAIGIALSTTGSAQPPTRTAYAAHPRTFKLLVFPIDFTDEIHKKVVPNHVSWQTRDLLHDALFRTNFTPIVDGKRLAAGSLADIVGYELLGVRLEGKVFDEYPEDMQEDGWFKYTLQPGEAPYFGAGVERDAETAWPELYRSFFARIGISPQWPIDHGFDTVYFLTGGGGGSVRRPFGYPLGNSGMENWPDRDNTAVRFDWVGTFNHEFAHMFTGLPDFYGHVWEHNTYWDLLSIGDKLGAFPAPFSGWLARAHRLARVEQTLAKGESARVFLPQPARGRTYEMLIADNSSVGENDQLVAEVRRRHSEPDAVYDTAFAGMPDWNTSGLLVANVDQGGSGNFPSYVDDKAPLESPLPVFGLPVERLSNTYSLAPIVELKRADGVMDDWTDLYESGGRGLLGSYPGEPELRPLRSSANPDGDVLWEFQNITDDMRTLDGVLTPGIRFDAQWQGRSLAIEATRADVWWMSPAGRMRVGVGTASNGWVYAQGAEYTSERGRRHHDNLWINTNRAGSAFSFRAETSFRHTVAVNGERLTGTFHFPAPAMPSSTTREAKLTIAVRTFPEMRPVITPVLEKRFVAPPGESGSMSAWSADFSADLTEWAGEDVELQLRVEAPRPETVGLLSSYFLRKAERPLSDLIGTEARPVARNVTLEDGVTYGRALLMPLYQDTSLTYVTRPVRLPAGGVVLRGSVGFRSESVNNNKGATVRLTLDDGLHRFRVRSWDPPLLTDGKTWVKKGPVVGVGFGEKQEWGSRLAWSGDAWAQVGERNKEWIERWSGDWVRGGDFNGDGRDDLAVFTQGERPRVGVALAGAESFGAIGVWQQNFAREGERPFAADLNGDRRTDIASITPSGNVNVAFSDGRSFGLSLGWGRGLVRPGEVPSFADVNGDRRADLVTFVKSAEVLRGDLGSVYVALNAGNQFSAPTLWSASACLPGSVLLVADVSRDGRADAICIHPDSRVWVARSTGERFGPPTEWLVDGPTFKDPPSFVDPTWPYPGPDQIQGAIPFVGYRNEVPYLIWFNRTDNLPETDTRRGDVWAAPALADRFDTPQRIDRDFGSGIEWPLVGDFNGDHLFDLAVSTVTRPNIWDHYFRKCPVNQRTSCYPADMYVSPKAVQLPVFGDRPPRLNRLVLDLTALAGRSVSFELRADAGPDWPGDSLLWPQLRLTRRPVNHETQISYTGASEVFRGGGAGFRARVVDAGDEDRDRAGASVTFTLYSCDTAGGPCRARLGTRTIANANGVAASDRTILLPPGDYELRIAVPRSGPIPGAVLAGIRYRVKDAPLVTTNICLEAPWICTGRKLVVVRPGDPFVLRGTVIPSRAGAAVRFSYRKHSARVWHPIARRDENRPGAFVVSGPRRAVVDRREEWAKTIYPTRTGDYDLRVAYVTPRGAKPASSIIRVRVTSRK
jgi:hypothetical protein